MLDYTLVTPKATYRMLTPRDMPAFLRLVQAYYREDLPGAQVTPEKLMATLKTLGPRKDKGSVLVFERDEALVGYCILINYWSNEYSGTVVAVDELYVIPEQRGQGIAGDFLTLLHKVAPQGCAAIQLEVNATNKKALSLYRNMGFKESGRIVMIKGIERT